MTMYDVMAVVVQLVETMVVALPLHHLLSLVESPHLARMSMKAELACHPYFLMSHCECQLFSAQLLLLLEAALLPPFLYLVREQFWEHNSVNFLGKDLGQPSTARRKRDKISIKMVHASYIDI